MGLLKNLDGNPGFRLYSVAIGWSIRSLLLQMWKMICAFI